MKIIEKEPYIIREMIKEKKNTGTILVVVINVIINNNK